jgi:hypothetical protein
MTVIVFLESFIRNLVDLVLRRGNPYMAFAQYAGGTLVATIGLSSVFDLNGLLLKLCDACDFSGTNNINILYIVVGTLAVVCFFLARNKVFYRPYSALNILPNETFNNQIYIAEEKRFSKGGTIDLSFRLKIFAPYQEVYIEGIELDLFHKDGRMAATAPQTIRYEKNNSSCVWEWDKDHSTNEVTKIEKQERIEFSISNKPLVYMHDEPDEWKDGILRIIVKYRTNGKASSLLRQMDYQLEPIGISRKIRLANLWQVMTNKPINPIKS